MAQNLQSLKRRIKTSKNIAQIAKAMEMIAASKIKRAQTMVANNKPYAQAIIEHTITALAKSKDKKYSHLYINTNNAQDTLIIALSPDKGLCGALITNMARKLLEIEQKNIHIIAIGKKIERIAAKLNMNLIASFNIGTSLPSYSQIFPLIKLIEENYIKGHVGKVEIFYPEFTSVFTQTPKFVQLLPIQNIEQQNPSINEKEYLFEPSAKDLLDTLLPYYIEVSLYNFLIEAHTSEQAARMLAMQNAKNNAGDIADFLTLTYNKSRQERITNELLDLTNGQVTA